MTLLCDSVVKHLCCLLCALIWSASYARYVFVYSIPITKLALFDIRPELRRDYPLNLSILLSGGKENNNDSPSKGD